MRYIPNTIEQREEMLKEIGVSSFEELLAGVPQALRATGGPDMPAALPEMEVEQAIYQVAGQNADFFALKPLIGAGAYRHHVPAALKSLLERQEFSTSYTPYQPELSQGTLQSMFECQTYLARLTGLEVVIPSMYDGATATAEAALMSMRLTRKNRLVVSAALHPFYLETLRTYVEPHATEIVEVACENGLVDIKRLQQLVDDGTASVVVQNPNFFGGIEDLAQVSDLAHSRGALMVTAVAEAMSLGVLKGPGELGADIVACDTQSFGMDLSFGGPHNACLAARRDYVRQLPGRIVGESRDVDGKRVFVMTLRAREQDIRRARATSNICSNHGLNATATNIYLSLLGTEGLYRLSSLNTKASHYLESLLLRSGKYERVFDCPFYNEFVLKSSGPLPDMKARLLEGGFLPPLELGTLFDKAELRDAFLFAVTEVLTRADLDRIGSILSR